MLDAIIGAENGIETLSAVRQSVNRIVRAKTLASRNEVGE